MKLRHSGEWNICREGEEEETSVWSAFTRTRRFEKLNFHPAWDDNWRKIASITIFLVKLVLRLLTKCPLSRRKWACAGGSSSPSSSLSLLLHHHHSHSALASGSLNLLLPCFPWKLQWVCQPFKPSEQVWRRQFSKPKHKQSKLFKIKIYIFHRHDTGLTLIVYCIIRRSATNN